MKTLIVYYSRTGNTKVVAELIHDQVGGDLVALETQIPRPTNYRDEVDLNEREQNQGILPVLKNEIPDFNQYQQVFIGAPTWSMALPQAMLTFLKTYDWTGKTVHPFNTNGGYGAGRMVAQIQEIVGNSNISPILSVTGDQALLAGANIAEKVTTWLQKTAN